MIGRAILGSLVKDLGRALLDSLPTEEPSHWADQATFQELAEWKALVATESMSLDGAIQATARRKAYEAKIKARVRSESTP